ncbi:MAG: hypothetical protein AAGC56_07335 [Pseudomonadota bacterium]
MPADPAEPTDLPAPPGVRVEPMLAPDGREGALLLVTPRRAARGLVLNAGFAAALLAAPFLIGPTALLRVVDAFFVAFGSSGGLIGVAVLIGAAAAARAYFGGRDWGAMFGALRPKRFEIWPEAVVAGSTTLDRARLGAVRRGAGTGAARYAVAVETGAHWAVLADGMTRAQADALAAYVAALLKAPPAKKRRSRRTDVHEEKRRAVA